MQKHRLTFLLGALYGRLLINYKYYANRGLVVYFPITKKWIPDALKEEFGGCISKQKSNKTEGFYYVLKSKKQLQRLEKEARALNIPELALFLNYLLSDGVGAYRLKSANFLNRRGRKKLANRSTLPAEEEDVCSPLLGSPIPGILSGLPS